MKSTLDVWKSDAPNNVEPIIRDSKTDLQNMYDNPEVYVAL